MENKQTICVIVAIGPDNVIGQNGVMPWHCKSDLYHFQKITTPYPCIFGRTTFENLPIKPLPNRLNLVCSSKYTNTYKNGVFYADSIQSALNECKKYPTVFICGGAQIYKYAFDNDLIDILYLSIIKNSVLEDSIYKNPGAYCRFCLDISRLFNSPKWHVKQMFYPEKELPVDVNNTTAEFFRCNRVR